MMLDRFTRRIKIDDLSEVRKGKGNFDTMYVDDQMHGYNHGTRYTGEK